MKRDPLLWAALGAVLVVLASAEYDLARACGFGLYVAAGVPGALDIYAVRALRAGRDVAAVVVTLILVNAASHLVTARLLPVSVPLVVTVSAIAPLVLWRVHRLRAEPEAELPEPVPVPVPAEEQLVEAVEGDGVSLSKGLGTSGTPAPEPAEPDLVPVAVEPVPVLSRAVVVGPFKADAGTRGGTGFDLEVPDWVKPPEPGAEPAEPAASSGAVVDLPAGVSAEHIVTVKTWLVVEPELTGTEIGTRLGKSDSYGRRVRRAAMAA